MSLKISQLTTGTLNVNDYVPTERSGANFKINLKAAIESLLTGGTVTSVNLTAPAAGITVSGGPVTNAGSITLALADDLAALEALSGTNTIYYRSGTSTWTAVVIGSGLSFTGGTLSASGGGLSDGDKGDVTVSSSGTVWTIDNDVVTYAKMQNISAASRLLGRGSASGSGDTEELTVGTGLAISGTVLQPADDLAALEALSGTNTIYYRSGSNTWTAVTISTGLSFSGGNLTSTITQYTDEMAQDAVGAMVASSLTYADATPLLSVTPNTTVQKIEVTKNSGSVVGTRKQLNFIEGSNVTITITDDVGNDQIDITIASSGGASGYATVQEEGSSLTQRPTINFVGSALTAADDSGNSRTNVSTAAIINAIADLSSTGLIARTGAGTVSVRTIAGTTNQITVTNGGGVSGNPTIGLEDNIVIASTIRIPQGGLGLDDTGGDHILTVNVGTNFTADRVLTITTGDADRTLTLSGNATISGTNTGDQTITLTGDVTGSGTGSFAATIANNVVSYAKMQDISAASRLLGRGSAAGSGDPQELTVGTGLQISGTVLQPGDDLAALEALSGTNTIYYRSGSNTWTAVTISTGLSFSGGTLSCTVTAISDGDKGDITVSSSGTVWTIDNDVVTFAKMQNITTGRLLGRTTASSGDVEEISAGTGLSLASTTLGLSSNALKKSFGIVIDGGGSAITTGIKGDVIIPYNMTITGWTIVADQTGSIVIDVFKSNYASYPPSSSIAGTEKPTLSSASKNQDNSLSTWTTSVSAGDIIRFNVDSASTVTRVTLIVEGNLT